MFKIAAGSGEQCDNLNDFINQKFRTALKLNREPNRINEFLNLMQSGINSTVEMYFS